MKNKDLVYVLIALGIAVLVGLGIVVGQGETTPLGGSGFGF